MSSRGSAANARGTQGRAILVVDDDPDLRALVAELLSERGYAVVVACDGQDAVELLEEGLRPCLIVLDLSMPRMDGWTFLAHLRENARSAVPVLVTSAVARDRPPAGADAFLEKPYEAAQLRAAVARLSSPHGAVLERP
jgi:two-component system, chemotaxis family, chemotaxis protein CheY